MRTIRTQVGIVGAGPSGLLLAHLLNQYGIDSIVLELRSRAYLEKRVRAGLLEQGTVDVLRKAGLAGRLDAQARVDAGFELRFAGERHRIPYAELTGSPTYMYGQQEVVKDLLGTGLGDSGQVRFEVDDATVHGVDGDEPVIRATLDGVPTEIRCDFVAGCDGHHGVCRRTPPAGALTTYEHTYPCAWLGVLATAAPTGDELVYAVHERGFALYSMRTPTVSRLYLQVGPDEDLADWPDDRIWAELDERFAVVEGPPVNRGPTLEKSITGMRSFAVAPMRYGRLFLAGDAAHIVPPTMAKGLNLAVADVDVLATALDAYYRTGDTGPLDAYSGTCLRAMWRAQDFSADQTSLLHSLPGEDAFTARLRRSRLRNLVGSRAAMTAFAEDYTGVSRARG